MRTTDAAPKAYLVRNSRFWARIPKPNVARARNRPDSRMAGMATIAPTGTMISADSSMAGRYGTPMLRRWASVVAPKTTKVAWHSDTCRDSPTRSERLTKTRTNPSVDVAVSSCEPLRRAGGTTRPGARPGGDGPGEGPP